MPINIDDKENQTVQLLFACIRGDKGSLIKQLLTASTKGSDLVDVCREDGWTALHYASSSGKNEIVRILATWGASLDCITATTLSTPLHLAAKRGHLPVVHTLLELGANDMLADVNGWTAAEVAEACGNAEIAFLLYSNRKEILGKHRLPIQAEGFKIPSNPAPSGKTMSPISARKHLAEIDTNKAHLIRSCTSMSMQHQNSERSKPSEGMKYVRSSMSTDFIMESRGSACSLEAFKKTANFRSKLEPLKAAAQNSIAILETQLSKESLQVDPEDRSGSLTFRCLQQVSQRLSRNMTQTQRKLTTAAERRCREFR